MWPQRHLLLPYPAQSRLHLVQCPLRHRRCHFLHRFHRRLCPLLPASVSYTHLDVYKRQPEAYAQVVATRPQQVLAIYIRDVTQNPQRDAEIALLAAQAQLHKIALLLVENTLQAAEHAARHGYIDSATLPSIRADHARSAEPLDLIEHLVGEDD